MPTPPPHTRRVRRAGRGADPAALEVDPPSPTPLPASTVAASKVSRSALQVVGSTATWLESRPADGGRQVLVGWRSDTGAVDLSPPGVSVRTRAHEYGGAATAVAGTTLWYCDDADQGIHRCDVGGSSPGTLLTPLAGGGSRRYADLRPLPGGNWLVAVEEEVGAAGATAHRLVAVGAGGELVGLTGTGGFVAAPRPSPDGRELVWIVWHHPHMPWDSSELWRAPIGSDGSGRPLLGRPHLVAGGEGTSVGQPAWLSDGALLFMWDPEGWWQPYRATSGGPPERRCGARGEFHAPDWAFGQATAADVGGGVQVARLGCDGVDRLVVLGPGVDVEPRTVDQPCVAIGGVAVLEGEALVLGTPAAEPPGVFLVPLDGDGAVRRIAGDAAGAPPGFRAPRPLTVPGPGGPVHALVHEPLVPWPGTTGAGGRPPLVVWAHGGPTGSSGAGYDPVVAFLTTRGLAVAAVDYRGSSGYGRAYRQALAGAWGIADVDDCVAVARALAAAGEVDGGRMAIRGTSAGGFTALAAMARSDVFAGAVGWYPVTDLERLAAETHDFESRYLDELVGPLPGAAGRYRERSPAWQASRITGAVLVLQGTDDAVVPPDQARRFAEAVRAAGGRCDLRLFDGEGHGFRRAGTIEAALDAEWSFYRSLFGAGPTAGGPGGTR
jgi:acetyl esterase/lipase